MSTWTMEEVKGLDEKYGGGNEYCRAKWFAKITEGELAKYTPKEGDPLDNYKKFVHMVYEQSKWFDENGKPAAGNVDASTTTMAAKPSTESVPATSVKQRRTPPTPQRSSNQQINKDEDLLILDFDAKVTVSSTTPPLASQQLQSTTPLSDEWGAFTTPSPSLSSKPTPSISDDWTFQEAPSVISNAPTMIDHSSSPIKQPTASSAFFPTTQSPQPHSTLMGGVFPQILLGHQPQQQSPPRGTGNAFGMNNLTSTTIPMSNGAKMNGLTSSNSTSVNDPFSHLHAYNSAPAAMINRASSGSNGNAALASNMMMRANSTGTANAKDPFAGLI